LQLAIVKEQLILGSLSEKWDKLAHILDREREVACHAYLDLIAGQTTKNVELALKLNLGSPMLIEVPYILELIGDMRGKKVLDAGCGGGFYSLWLSENGAEVLGIDGSEEMIKIAKEKASRKMLSTKFLIADITDLRIKDDMFDLVLSTLVLMELRELDRGISELVRVTKNGGDIVISVQHPILTAGDWERESGQKLFRKLNDYFNERALEVVWENERKERVPLKYYHRSLQAYIQPFLKRRCVLTKLIEPHPHKVYKILNPREYEDTKRIPHFIIFKFQKRT
jgi:2-polyprenyl-3-methyl-5-hydroxy-6-metoxy-1,4-benzoquinol methylase